jgi:hypothetical protein
MSMKSLSLVAAAALALCAGAAQAAEGFVNGGFETAGATTPAEGWLGGGSVGYSRVAGEGVGGSFAANIAANVTSASAVVLQNAVEQGGLPTLLVGDTPMLSFMAKGFQGDTGNAGFSLRYLTSTGAIVYNSGFIGFGGDINPNTYTKVEFTGATVSQAGLAAFLEISNNIGPVGDRGCGFAASEPCKPGNVFVDNVSLTVAVPEPGTYALMLAGLAGLGLVAKRRRQA